MNTKTSPRLRFVALWVLVFLGAAVHLARDPAALLLFIPLGLAIAVPIGIAAASSESLAVITAQVRINRAIAIGCAALLLVTLYASEAFALWSVGNKFLYYDLFPIVIAAAAVTFFVGNLPRNSADQDSEQPRPSILKICAISLTFAMSVVVALLFLSSTNFTGVVWWAFLPFAVAVFYCLNLTYRMAVELLSSRPTGRYLPLLASGTACAIGTVTGLVASRATGLGISLFHAVILALLAASLCGLFAPFPPDQLRGVRKAFAALSIFLLGACAVVFGLMQVSDVSDFGYIAKSHYSNVYVLPGLTILVSLVSLTRLKS